MSLPESSGRADDTGPPGVGFDECYAAHFQRLTMQLYAYTGDVGVAQDVVQEAFCRALARWDRVGWFDDPLSWVRKVAWNLATKGTSPQFNAESYSIKKGDQRRLRPRRRLGDRRAGRLLDPGPRLRRARARQGHDRQDPHGRSGPHHDVEGGDQVGLRPLFGFKVGESRSFTFRVTSGTANDATFSSAVHPNGAYSGVVTEQPGVRLLDTDTNGNNDYADSAVTLS
jgi:hypothetical protein